MVYPYFEGNPFQQDNLTVQQSSLFYRSASVQRDGWVRDLSEKIKAKADELVTKSLVTNQVTNEVTPLWLFLQTGN